jgi:NAD(P)-dependent dehydrogenase (short-subunit alcohol dehydrogenase family)
MNHNLREQIAVITGASHGIGRELTRKLLSEGWQVAAVNRSDYPEDDRLFREAALRGQLRIYRVADLADYASLRRVITEIKEKEQRIDVLFNNAGGSFPELRYSSQGRELHYELMTVVPYILLMELQELLMRGEWKTVVQTSSSAMNYVKEISIQSLEHPGKFRKLVGPYAASKLALSLWTRAIAPQLAKEGIRIVSVDPGSNNTLRKGKKSGLPLVVKWLMKLFFAPPTHGADRLYDGAFGAGRHETGVFLRNGRAAELKFRDQAGSILDRMNAIYRHEYLQERQERA